MKLRWNTTTALATYLAIGIIGALLYRASCTHEDGLPVGKTIHLMPMTNPPPIAVPVAPQ